MSNSVALKSPIKTFINFLNTFNICSDRTGLDYVKKETLISLC